MEEFALQQYRAPCCLFKQKPRRNLKKTQDLMKLWADLDQETTLSKITRANNNGKIQLTGNKSYAMYYINLHFHI
jgi:hypothetical protein